MQHDLFTQSKPGESNGKALGYIARGEGREQLRNRIKAGELPGVNMELVKREFEFRGK